MVIVFFFLSVRLKKSPSGNCRGQRRRKPLFRPKEMDEAQMEGPALCIAGGGVREVVETARW